MDLIGGIACIIGLILLLYKNQMGWIWRIIGDMFLIMYQLSNHQINGILATIVIFAIVDLFGCIKNYKEIFS